MIQGAAGQLRVADFRREFDDDADDDGVEQEDRGERLQ